MLQSNNNNNKNIGKSLLQVCTPNPENRYYFHVNFWFFNFSTFCPIQIHISIYTQNSSTEQPTIYTSFCDQVDHQFTFIHSIECLMCIHFVLYLWKWHSRSVNISQHKRENHYFVLFFMVMQAHETDYRQTIANHSNPAKATAICTFVYILLFSLMGIFCHVWSLKDLVRCSIFFHIFHLTSKRVFNGKTNCTLMVHLVFTLFSPFSSSHGCIRSCVCVRRLTQLFCLKISKLDWISFRIPHRFAILSERPKKRRESVNENKSDNRHVKNFNHSDETVDA